MVSLSAHSFFFGFLRVCVWRQRSGIGSLLLLWVCEFQVIRLAGPACLPTGTSYQPLLITSRRQEEPLARCLMTLSHLYWRAFLTVQQITITIYFLMVKSSIFNILQLQWVNVLPRKYMEPFLKCLRPWPSRAQVLSASRPCSHHSFLRDQKISIRLCKDLTYS